MRKLRLLKFFSGRYNLTLCDKKFIIPVLKGIGMDHFHPSEPWMTACIEQLLPLKSGSFVDVGVNIGQTLLKLRSIGECDYIGFEPNLNCVDYVHALIQENKLQHVTLIPFGISDRNQDATLHTYSDQSTDSSASLLEDFRPESKVIHATQVELIGPESLSSYFHNQVAIVKIDVEGFEWYVISGLEQIIEQYRPFLLVEILPVYDTQRQDRLERQENIERFLKQHTYVLFLIFKNEDGSLKELSRIEKIGIHGDLHHCDYLMVPVENVTQMLKSWKK